MGREPFLLPARIAPVRSLRVKVWLVVAVVALAPLGFVALWSAMERNIAGEMEARAAFAAEECSQRLEREGATAEDRAAAVEGTARVHGLRVRLLRDGEAFAGADDDAGTDLIHQIGMLFFGPDGAPSLAEYDATLGPLAERSEIRAALERGAASGCRTSPGGKLLACHAARRIRGGADAGAVVYVQESSRRAVRALYDLRFQLARLGLITMPLAVALAAWMGRRIVSPIGLLRRQALARAASPGAAAPPLTVGGQDELGDLAAAFNTLLAELERRQGENERFVADLVHEFKNPVAAVRAAADSLTSAPVDEARARRLGKVLLDSSARLDALVSQFLELARAEAGLTSEPRSVVDVAVLARGLCESIRAQHEGVTIEARADQEAPVLGVPHGLDALARNLIENAASFALPEGEGTPRVVVEVVAGAEQVLLRVTDSGPGIAAEDLPKVFDRFFTTRGRARGTGLGLALVKATAEAHGGAVRVSSEPGSGAVFEVVLPPAE